MDITEPDTVRNTLHEIDPEVVINCASYTAVDQAESEPERCFQINADGAKNLATACKPDCYFLHISTDFVFDGTLGSAYSVESSPNPLSIYGKSKLEGEQKVRQREGSTAIVRTAWLFGLGGPNFVSKILLAAHEKGSVQVVNDQKGSPTFTSDLAHCLLTFGQKRMTGLWHVTNSGEATWYDLTREAVRIAGIDAKVTPTTTDSFPRPAPRPADSRLSESRLESLGLNLPDWRDGLSRYLGGGFADSLQQESLRWFEIHLSRPVNRTAAQILIQNLKNIPGVVRASLPSDSRETTELLLAGIDDTASKDSNSFSVTDFVLSLQQAELPDGLPVATRMVSRAPAPISLPDSIDP
jgi:dTDP-4-dehydrorhamnose reductase